MNDKVKGIVLNIRPYGENNQLIKVLSENRGYLSFVVKGSNKITAKNRVMPLSVNEFIFDDKFNKTMFSLKKHNFIKSYYVESIDLLAFLSIFLELFTKEEVENSHLLYQDFIYVLDHLQTNNRYLLGCFLLARLMDYAGIRPYTDGCIICDNKSINGLSLKSGGFVCLKHLASSDEKDIMKLKKFRHINMADRNIILKLNEDENAEDFALWMAFVKEHSGLELKSYYFYKGL